MNPSIKHPGAGESADNAPASYTVSGFFKSEDAVNAVMHACLYRGVPRDLMDVAVSQAAAPQFYGGRARVNRDAWFSWTGRGALMGLVLSAILTLVIVMLPGFDTSFNMAIVQLLGPDIGVIAGAFLGAMYGWLKAGDVRPQFKRATLRNDAVLMLVHLQPQDEAHELEEIFKAQGGEEILVEPDMANSVGAE